MKQARKLNNKAMGVMSGPQPSYGQTLDGNLAQNSVGTPYGAQQTVLPGTTRGDSTAENEWSTWPYMVSGLTDFDPDATMPGSNLSALQMGSEAVATNAGMSDDTATGASVGGTASY